MSPDCHPVETGNSPSSQRPGTPMNPGGTRRSDQASSTFRTRESAESSLQMDEQAFIREYMELTLCREANARAIYMHLTTSSTAAPTRGSKPPHASLASSPDDSPTGSKASNHTD